MGEPNRVCFLFEEGAVVVGGNPGGDLRLGRGRDSGEGWALGGAGPLHSSALRG